MCFEISLTLSQKLAFSSSLAVAASKLRYLIFSLKPCSNLKLNVDKPHFVSLILEQLFAKEAPKHSCDFQRKNDMHLVALALTSITFISLLTWSGHHFATGALSPQLSTLQFRGVLCPFSMENKHGFIDNLPQLVTIITTNNTVSPTDVL